VSRTGVTKLDSCMTGFRGFLRFNSNEKGPE
jgi:hypothetical protein